MERWIGKIALVTGVSSGIGEAIAKTLVGAGVNVVGVARREERLQALSNTLKGSKGLLHPIPCDLQKETDILRVFQYAQDKVGGVDILVNNAGICYHESITDGVTDHLRAILEVNVLGAALCTREAVRSMRQRNAEGHIFNVNSVLGQNASISPVPISLYPASKFALHAMTENVKSEIQARKDKIKITGIYPGLVRTDLLGTSGGNPRAYDVLPCIEPGDIADALVYALSAPRNVQVEEIKISPMYQKL